MSETEEKVKSYKCGACGHVQARGKVWRNGWAKCRACDSCGATSWIPQTHFQHIANTHPLEIVKKCEIE